MKRAIVLTLCLVLPFLFLFASCSGDGDASNATTKTAAATTEPGGYTVTFLVGKKQYKVKAEPGSVPACPVDPVEAAAEDYTVRFTGWDKEIVAVTEDTTYTATYASGAEILAARNIPMYSLQGWEADDILGTAGRICGEWYCPRPSAGWKNSPSTPV